MRYLILAALVAVIALSAASVVSTVSDRRAAAVTKGERSRVAQGGQAFNGFDISNALIPEGDILGGGPPRDGIPAILKPKFVSVGEAGYVRDDDRVVGFVHKGQARAYPLRIVVWHEIVNDTVGGLPVAITYCPLCGTCMVFGRSYGGRELTFGVSGLLYQSDVLMYDHQTESLWSQLKMESISGAHAGTALRWLASEEMTWRAWKTRYPDSEVLSTDTGFKRNYGRVPYANYERTERTYFPVPKHRDELRNKEWVVGVVVNGIAKAYPVAELEKLGDNTLEDSVGGESLHVRYDGTDKRVEILNADSGEAVPHVSSYWFAWQAFYPRTKLHVHR